ncbi:MAG: DNA polymerase III subunit delta [Gammaproteobacteria bacterium]|nr:DNA polymerase III subunit delta [Gammaproteobacteria bacterium]
MEIEANKLKSSLDSGQLAPLYYIAGTEILLVQESAQAIIEAANQAGFDEVVRTEVGSRKDWDGVLVDAASPSLFAEKRLFDVTMTTNTIDKESSATIKTYLRDPDPNAILLARGKTFTYQHRSLAWFKNLVANAVVVIAEPLSGPQFNRWLDARARAFRLNLSDEAIDELANLTDGNLLAAHQELEKLALVFLNSTEVIGIDSLTKLNWSTGNTFGLIDAATQGQAAMVGKILKAVIRDGTDPLSVVGLIALQLRRMHAFVLGEQARLPRRLQAASRRIGRETLESLLIECSHVDSQRKGVLTGDPWQSIQALLLAMSGKPEIPLVETTVAWRTIDYES